MSENQNANQRIRNRPDAVAATAATAEIVRILSDLTFPTQRLALEGVLNALNLRGTIVPGRASLVTSGVIAPGSKDHIIGGVAVSKGPIGPSGKAKAQKETKSPKTGGFEYPRDFKESEAVKEAQDGIKSAQADIATYRKQNQLGKTDPIPADAECVRSLRLFSDRLKRLKEDYKRRHPTPSTSTQSPTGKSEEEGQS